MANLYDKNQTLNYLDSIRATMKKFTDMLNDWEEQYQEYIRNGIGDLTQEDLDNSIYANATPVEVTTAVGAMNTKFTQIAALPDLSAHRGQIEIFANRR